MTAPADDDLVPVSDRLHWMQVSRTLMVATLPILAVAVAARPAVIRELSLVGIIWFVVTAGAGQAARAGRRTATAALSATLMGDGLVLARAWYLLDDLHGSAGMIVLLHTMAVTLVASFRTGAKIALWHSLLALLILDAETIGLLGPVRTFPTRDVVVYLSGLWIAALATACLAAVNERELRRRRYDEQVLRELALKLGADRQPLLVVRRLARFAFAELSSRRVAVFAIPADTYQQQLAPTGVAAVLDHDGGDRLVQVSSPIPQLAPDEPILREQPRHRADSWLVEALPDARNISIIPFAVEQARGALVIEHSRRWPARYSGRVERRLVATARQAVAQTASALGRALAVAKLGDAANTDSLTGLVNRGHFDRLLRARLDRPEPMVLLILDLDHFKAVNDVHGHSVGDAVLRETAIALRAACFANDVVARYGGEEFVVLTSGATLEATMTGERLRAAVSRAATPVPVTASIGAACYPAEEATAAALIETADQRLYTAKRTGRNRAVTSAAEVLAATHVQSGAPNADREADLPSS